MKYISPIKMSIILLMTLETKSRLKITLKLLCFVFLFHFLIFDEIHVMLMTFAGLCKITCYLERYHQIFLVRIWFWSEFNFNFLTLDKTVQHYHIRKWREILAVFNLLDNWWIFLPVNYFLLYVHLYPVYGMC